MLKCLALTALVLAPLLAHPAASVACPPWFCGPSFGGCCRLNCGRVCPAPGPAPPVPPRAPVYVPQSYVQPRDVTVHELHREPAIERVPVTRYEDVTIDEGRYQTVWISRPVTRRIARTEYRDQVTYRSVLRPVARRVSRIGTQLVPTALAPSTLSGPIVSQLPPLSDPDPIRAAPPRMSSRPILGAPEFIDDSESGEWTDVPSRTARRAESGSVRSMSYEPSRGSSARRGASRFVPVHSARLRGASFTR